MVQHTQVQVMVSLLLVRLHDVAGRQFVWGLQVVAEVAAHSAPRTSAEPQCIEGMKSIM